MTLQRIGRALRHRNYRLFFAGQGISLIGTWMQRVAMNWLVYRLTGSPLLLGVVNFTGQAPTLVQTLVEDDKRGRVMSLHTMSVRGMVPLGSLIAGGLASQIGAPETVTLGGLCCVLGALIFASRRAAFKAPATSQPQ